MAGNYRAAGQQSCGTQMIAGIEGLRHAREMLDQAGRSASYPDTLISAAEDCWSASIDGTDWPVDLRVRLASVQRTMFRKGGIRTTVERMTPAEQSQLHSQLLDLIAAAERACGRD
jgi:hypothetical protein